MAIIFGVLWMVAGLYGLLMVVYSIGFLKSRRSVLPPADSPPHLAVAVIIPARNEAGRIEKCLSALAGQTYPAPLLQIIVVDDHSTDNTAAEVRYAGLPNLQLIQLADFPPPPHQAFKKYALSVGIAQATDAVLLLTTDADCTMSEKWVESMVNAFLHTRADALAAPVRLLPERSLAVLFQVLDFAVMQGITAAVNTLHIGTMANGANLAFARKSFNQVGGYQDTFHLASGDDFMLLNKIQRMPGSHICYVNSREAMVETPAQPDWRSFLNQRIRWASKSGKYPDPLLTTQLALVYLFNLMLLFSLPLMLTGLLHWHDWLLLWGIKIGSESLLAIPVLYTFRLLRYYGFFLILQPLHNLYIVVAGFLGFLGSYEWKSRRVQ